MQANNLKLENKNQKKCGFGIDKIVETNPLNEN